MTMSKPTQSELLFEQFLQFHGLPFERVPEGADRRPDYRINLTETSLFFEVKELTKDDDYTRTPCVGSCRKVGDHIRAKISQAREQIQFGRKKGFPSILLLFNALDPSQMFGTEAHDFRAAMYGDWTLDISCETGAIQNAYHGRNASFREDRNTSFGAVGLLQWRSGTICITLHENFHALVPVPFASLPTCFEVIRYELASTER
jgi:hypothetical protein